MQGRKFNIYGGFAVDFYPPQDLVLRPVDVVEVFAVVDPQFKGFDKGVVVGRGKEANAVDREGRTQIPEERRPGLALGGLEHARRRGRGIAVDQVEGAGDLVEEAVVGPRSRLAAEGEVAGLAVEKALARSAKQLDEVFPGLKL